MFSTPDALPRSIDLQPPDSFAPYREIAAKPQHMLIAFHVSMRQDFGLLQADGGAMQLCRAHAFNLPATLSSTAMRTATPLLT